MQRLHIHPKFLSEVSTIYKPDSSHLQFLNMIDSLLGSHPPTFIGILPDYTYTGLRRIPPRGIMTHWQR